jgi:acetyl esterase/lipase
MMIKIIPAVLILLLTGAAFGGDVKVEKDISYGPHERNVIDIYWKTDYKNAPIVFTIHGGAFRNGSKAYCNPDTQKLYLDKGCVVVSPNYRLLEKGASSIADCSIDCATGTRDSPG